MSLLDNLPHRCTIQRLSRTKGGLGGSRTAPTAEQTDVECWEQAATQADVLDYEKRGMSVTTKVYFAAQPMVTERHQIVITERNGVAVPAASQVAMDVVVEARPDASAGLGVLWKVMANDVTGSRS